MFNWIHLGIAFCMGANLMIFLVRVEDRVRGFLTGALLGSVVGGTLYLVCVGIGIGG